MKTSKILDMPENTIEGLEIETPIIESIYRNCLALIESAGQHKKKRDAAERNAKAALDSDDHEGYSRWMDISFKEDGELQLLYKILKDLGVSDEYIRRKTE